MVLGLLPIVGAPLPIMSYGGSSMLSIMIGLGIVMSCRIYDQDDVNWRMWIEGCGALIKQLEIVLFPLNYLFFYFLK